MRVRWAGMTSFWGYGAGTLAVIVVCRGGGLSPARLGDLAAAPLGLALCLARLGCFIAGCDYGKVTDLPWAMRFPSGSPAWRDHVRSGLVPPERTASLPVHPAQLYEAALGLLIALGAVWIARSSWAKERAGRVFLCAAAAYAVGRFGIEELRGDAGRGFQLGLSSGQIFALVLLVVIAAGFVVVRRRAAMVGTAVGAALLVLTSVAGDAHAQPQDPYAPQPQPADPYAPPSAPQPQPQPQPVAPYPVPMPPPGPPPPAASEAQVGRRILEAGAMLGWATPLNRRQGQVAPLAGPSLSVGLALGQGLGLWLDLDSLGNADASHGTLLLSGSMMTATRSGIELGARVGVGTTLVNFDEPAFRDVAGATMRAEAIASYPLGDQWALSFRPLSFDLLSSDNLGGPIFTWQVRAGLAYRFGPRRVGAPASPGGPPPPVAIGGAR